MKKTLLLSAFLLFVVFSSFSQSQKTSFNWLTGVWKINTNSGFIVESWEQVNDSLYKGKSVMVKGKDSILQESLEISKKDTTWYYTSTVVGQNNTQPVSFKIIFQRFGEFISENPAHDFPQRISYRRYLPMLMFASIEGNNKGRYSKRNFNFYQEDKNELFSYTLTPMPAHSNAAANDTIIANAFKKHLKFIDSLGSKNIVILGGHTNPAPDKSGNRTIIIKAADVDKAKAIIAKDPAIVSGTYKGELLPFTIQSWYPGNLGR